MVPLVLLKVEQMLHCQKKGNCTILSYKAKAEIGGKLAQLGSRLIQSTAKKLAAKFFKSFSEVVVEETA